MLKSTLIVFTTEYALSFKFLYSKLINISLLKLQIHFDRSVVTDHLVFTLLLFRSLALCSLSTSSPPSSTLSPLKLNSPDPRRFGAKKCTPPTSRGPNRSLKFLKSRALFPSVSAPRARRFCRCRRRNSYYYYYCYRSDSHLFLSRKSFDAETRTSLFSLSFFCAFFF
jgi:hypothetical protein